MPISYLYYWLETPGVKAAINCDIYSVLLLVARLAYSGKLTTPKICTIRKRA